MSKKMTFILGGTRSGKSSFAEKLAGASGEGVLFIATGKAVDDEMKERIAAHKLKRPSNWRTVEADGDIQSIFKELENSKSDTTGEETVLIDCVSFYVADLMNTHNKKEDEIIDQFKDIKDLLTFHRNVVMVSSEVGLGIVPSYPLGREFRDTLGAINQMLAETADQVIMMVAGIPMTVKNRLEN